MATRANAIATLEPTGLWLFATVWKILRTGILRANQLKTKVVSRSSGTNLPLSREESATFATNETFAPNGTSRNPMVAYGSPAIWKIIRRRPRLSCLRYFHRSSPRRSSLLAGVVCLAAVDLSAPFIIGVLLTLASLPESSVAIKWRAPKPRLDSRFFELTLTEPFASSGREVPLPSLICRHYSSFAFASGSILEGRKQAVLSRPAYASFWS